MESQSDSTATLSRHSPRVSSVPERYTPIAHTEKKRRSSLLADGEIGHSPSALPTTGVVAERPRGRPPKNKIWDLGSGKYVEIVPELKTRLSTLTPRVIDTRQPEFSKYYTGENAALLTASPSVRELSSQSSQTSEKRQWPRASSVSSAGGWNKRRRGSSLDTVSDGGPFKAHRVRAWSDVEETLAAGSPPETPELAAENVIDKVYRLRNGLALGKAGDENRWNNTAERSLLKVASSLKPDPLVDELAGYSTTVDVFSSQLNRSKQSVSRCLVPEACLVQLWSTPTRVEVDGAPSSPVKVFSGWGRMAAFGPRLPLDGCEYSMKSMCTPSDSLNDDQKVHVLRRDGITSFYTECIKAKTLGAQLLLVVNNGPELCVIMTRKPGSNNVPESELVPTVMITETDAEKIREILIGGNTSVTMMLAPIPSHASSWGKASTRGSGVEAAKETEMETSHIPLQNDAIAPYPNDSQALALKSKQLGEDPLTRVEATTAPNA